MADTHAHPLTHTIAAPHPAHPENPSLKVAREALSKYYGYHEFRAGQETLISAVLNGRDALGVMPTGAGKSLCYQIPGIVLPGLALVISPLVSLMGDQVRNLIAAGVRGSYLNSTLTPGQQRTVMQRAEAGTYKIMYVAPERLADPAFKEFAKRIPIPLIAIDEAHCVSQWGQDFRPSYKHIAQFIAELPKRPPVIALTATATSKVREDVIKLLELNNPQTVATGYDRPNLRFGVEKHAPKEKRQRVASFIQQHAGESGIIYCTTRRDVDALHDWLDAFGIAAARYHAGMTADQRRESQQKFIADDAPIMVATNAFGMGIDKSNVRWVIHYSMPQSLEAYYQEAGRAGRDGLPSECLLLWSDGDVATCRYFIEEGRDEAALDETTAETVRASKRRLLAAMMSYCRTTGCLRQHILNYFEDGADSPNGMPDGAASAHNCRNCSNCLGSFDGVDVTDTAKRCIQCVREVNGSFGKSMIADVVRGSKAARVLEAGLESLQSYGTVKDGLPQVKEVIELLAAEGILQISGGKYPTVSLGPGAYRAQADDFVFTMKKMRKAKPARKATAFGSFNAAGLAQGSTASASNDLLERLRTLRKQLADEAGIPPYMVFSDKTLQDMCAKNPQTRSEFLEVHGVGAAKLERFGEAFLAEITR